MSAFASLRKNRNSNLETLQSGLKAVSGNKTYEDRIETWRISKDDQGNGGAIIRFLPAPQMDEGGLPVQRRMEVFFKNPKTNRYYVEASRKTLGDDERDPVAEYYDHLWATKDPGLDKKEAGQKFSKWKARAKYYANIFVVKDPSNPENDGKIFRFDFGTSVYNKIQEAVSPTNGLDEAFDPFSLWNGANFRLKVFKAANGYPSYDNSTFDQPSPFLGDSATDEAREIEYNKLESLEALLEAPYVKEYDVLKEKFDKVMGFVKSDNPYSNEKTNDISEVSAKAPTTKAGITESEVDNTEFAETDSDAANAFFDGL